MRVVSLPLLRLSRYIPDSSLYSCYSLFLERRFPKFYTIPSFIPTATRRRSRSIFSESPLASLYKTEVFSHQQAFTIFLLRSTIFFHIFLITWNSINFLLRYLFPCLLWDGVLMYSPAWPRTPVSASWVLWFLGCSTMPYLSSCVLFAVCFSKLECK